MQSSRRLFIQKSILTLPALGALAACGGGSGSGAGTGAVPGAAAVPPTSNSTPSTSNSTPYIVPVGQDLSAGLTQHGKSPVNYSALAKPAKGATVTDPDFGAKIIRITDCVNDFNNLCVAPAYPTAMAWNCDETRFILYVPGSTMQSGGKQGWAMYDGTSYAFIKFLDINPGDVEQFYWDHADPATLRYIDNHSSGSTILADLTAINVETGVKTIIYSFLPNGLPDASWPKTGPVRCGYPFALGVNANGDRIWGLGAGGVPNVSGELGLNVFGFNETTKTFVRYDTSIVPQPQARGSTPFPSVSGKYFIWNAAVGLESQSTTQSAILDATTGKLVRWVNFDTNEHCDTAMDANGNDLLVGSQFSRNTGGNGNVIVCNINTGAVSNDVGESSGWGYPTTGSLSGSTAWKNPSWVVTGMTGNIYGTGSNGVATPGSNGNSGPTANPCTVLDQELMITNMTSGTTWRIAHHRSTGNYSNASQSNYWAQPNVTFSTSGTRILFNSDWGDGNPANPVVNPNAPIDTYVLILPSFGA
ncbi:MAG: hypothetical protein JXR43_01505 [Burkholderiaceae bacterium]|nr:hypothetical protein [Burkholderiaceae bacterium]